MYDSYTQAECSAAVMEIMETAVGVESKDDFNEYVVIKKTSHEWVYIDLHSCPKYHTEEEMDKYGFMTCTYLVTRAKVVNDR